MPGKCYHNVPKSKIIEWLNAGLVIVVPATAMANGGGIAYWKTPAGIRSFGQGPGWVDQRAEVFDVDTAADYITSVKRLYFADEHPDV